MEDTPSTKWGRGTEAVPGQNKMGRILMEIRNEVQGLSDDKVKYIPVQSPAIQDRGKMMEQRGRGGHRGYQGPGRGFWYPYRRGYRW